MRLGTMILQRLTHFLLIRDNRKHLYSAILVFMATYLVLLNKGRATWYFDAGLYYNLADTFYDQEGHFSITNYDAEYRGYVFSFFLLFIRGICDLTSLEREPVFQFFSVLLFSLSVCYLLPLFVEKLFKDLRVSIGQILLFAAVFLFFWGYNLDYPLTDIPTVFLLFLTLYLTMQEGFVIFFFAGLLSGIIIGFRPVYMISLPPLVLYIWFGKKQVGKLKRAGYLALFLAGITLVSIPQMLINQKKYQTLSPLVQTDKSYKHGLYLWQLLWGLSVEKYETNLGKEYASQKVNFISKRGQAIHALAVQKRDTVYNIPTYLRLYTRFPFEMTCIQAKHIFNSLDIRDRCVYAENICDKKYGFTILNFSLLFLFLILIMFEGFWRYRKLLYLSAIFLLPYIFTIPTAVEARFALPLFMIIYLTLAFYANYEKLYKIYYKPRLAKMIVAWFLFVLMCLVLSQETYSGLEFFK